MPHFFVFHRWCPITPESLLIPIGISRDKKLTHLARPETVRAFQAMGRAAEKAQVRLHVIWAYRSPALQKQQYAEAKEKFGRRKGILWLAPPGFSEHQTGWVLDIGDFDDGTADDNATFEGTKAYRWLKQHAGEFGFELSFRRDNWQGVSFEPWHWRYVGNPEARSVFHPSGMRSAVVWTRSAFEAVRRMLLP